MSLNVPMEWQVRLLGDVASRVRRRLEGDPDHILMITSAGGFVTQSDKYGRFMAGKSLKDYVRLQEGEFSYNRGNSTRYPQGCVFRLEDWEEAAVPNVYISFALDDGAMDPDFAAQYFAAGGLNRQLGRVITSTARSNGLLNISIKDFFACEVPLPPLSEQRKIAAILSSVDDAIAATRKVIEQTKRVKQGLLQTLMTRGIGHTRFKSTVIGEIPEAWELVPLDDVCTHITKGATPTTYGYQWIDNGDGGVLFLRSECISEEGFQMSGSARIPEPAHASMSRSEIRSGDVLVTITGNVGRVGQVPEEIERANINQHLARVRVEHDDLFQDFVHLALQTKRQRDRFETIVTGLAYPQLSLKQIRDTIVPVPPRTEQTEIVERITAVQEVIRRSERSLAAWQNMKQGLMQDLLTGRVRVQPD